MLVKSSTSKNMREPATVNGRRIVSIVSSGTNELKYPTARPNKSTSWLSSGRKDGTDLRSMRGRSE